MIEMYKKPIAKEGISIYWFLTILFIILKLGLHFFTNTNYELHRDEMLYFNMSEHLDFGFVSVPPVISLLAAIVKFIFGYSVFGIRFIPALIGAASILLIAKIIRELGGGVVALTIAASGFLLSTGFLLFNTLFTPNAVEQFFWLLITWLVFRMVNTNNPKLWLWIGFWTGIAFLNKYSVLILVLGYFLAIILSEHKRILASKFFYYAVCIGLILVSPNIFWQHSHNWPVVHHLDELQKTQMVNMNYFSYLADIFSLNLFGTFIWLFGLTGLLFFKHEQRYRYIGVSSLIIILLFMLLKGKGYYIMGIIPFLFATGGYMIDKYLAGKLVWVKYSIIATTAITSLFALPYGLPVMSHKKLQAYSHITNHLIPYPFMRWEDGENHKISQVYSDMTGWRELVSLVVKAYKKLPKEEQEICTIYGERNYGYAGAIHFYGREYNLPDAITFLDNYVIWAPGSIPNGPFIYINYNTNDFDLLFTEIEEIGKIENPYFRENGLKVFLCKSPKVDIVEVYRQKAIQEKSIYR